MGTWGVERALKVLVVGAGGMLGHKVVQTLDESGHTVWATVRSAMGVRLTSLWSQSVVLVENVNVRDIHILDGLIDEFRPEAVVNCVGIIKQRSEAQDPTLSIAVNSLFPHLLAESASRVGARTLHFSTDCVFSGSSGNYGEEDFADASDLYGRSKYLGELRREGTLTLRTSIVGREVQGHKSLLDWFLQQVGEVPGFPNAVFSGLTTTELARVVERCLTEWPYLRGVYHVGGRPIDKFQLLTEFRRAFAIEDIAVYPDKGTTIDRSLDSSRFYRATGYTPPAWTDMVEEIAGEVGYPNLRPYTRSEADD